MWTPFSGCPPWWIQRMGSPILSCCLPFGKAGGLQILCCQGFEVNDYNFTLDALALKPSDFCNDKVYQRFFTCVNWIIFLYVFFRYFNFQFYRLNTPWHSITTKSVISDPARGPDFNWYKNFASLRNWNDGTMEWWNHGVWPPARRPYSSERILEWWV